jgi:hypothetical protein
MSSAAGVARRGCGGGAPSTLRKGRSGGGSGAASRWVWRGVLISAWWGSGGVWLHAPIGYPPLKNSNSSKGRQGEALLLDYLREAFVEYMVEHTAHTPHECGFGVQGAEVAAGGSGGKAPRSWEKHLQP